MVGEYARDFRELRVERGHLHVTCAACPRARLRHDDLRGVARDREADADVAVHGAAGIDLVVDADDAAGRVEQGPPELPWLIGASVWIAFGIEPVRRLDVRPVALTIPAVIVRSRPNGLPMA